MPQSLTFTLPNARVSPSITRGLPSRPGASGTARAAPVPRRMAPARMAVVLFMVPPLQISNDQGLFEASLDHIPNVEFLLPCFGSLLCVSRRDAPGIKVHNPIPLQAFAFVAAQE